MGRLIIGELLESLDTWDFRSGDEIIVVMVENFDKEPVDVISSVSRQTLRFEPKLSDIMYRVNRFEPVNYIPALERVDFLAVHNIPSQMVENVRHR